MKTKKKQEKNKKDIDNNTETEYNEDIVMEDIEEYNDNATVKKLRERLNKCVEEKQEYLDGWQRLKADFVNAKKKEEESRAVFVSFVKEGLMLDMLSTIDNFDIAFSNKEVWESVDKNWRVGIEHIYSQFLKTLEEHGLKQFDPEEENFDHNRHDSIETIITDKKDNDHKVAEVVRKGYELNGKVIRPAKVKVWQFEN